MELVQLTTFTLTMILAVFTLTVWIAVLYAVYSAKGLRRIIEETFENPQRWKAEEAAKFVKTYFREVKFLRPSRRRRR